MNDPCDSRSLVDTQAQSRPANRALTIETIIEAGNWSDFEPLNETIDNVAAALDQSTMIPARPALVALSLSDDARVGELNGAYRDKPSATNVLSFPNPGHGPQAPGGPAFLGDIVLACETMRREALAQGKPAAHHFQHLLVHGILHLCGYDHIDDHEAAVMEDAERRVLQDLAIGDPYAGREIDFQLGSDSGRGPRREFET